VARVAHDADAGTAQSVITGHEIRTKVLIFFGALLQLALIISVFSALPPLNCGTSAQNVACAAVRRRLPGATFVTTLSV
jgi:hypothetical protein